MKLRTCDYSVACSSRRHRVLAVPVISADPATETAPALVRRLLALTPEAV